MTDRDLRRGAVSLGLLFLALGVVAATWISRIPAVQADLGLSPGVLGLALLGLPAGSILASLLLPRLLHGSGRSVVVAAMPAAALTLLAPGWAGSALTLALALLAFGATTGALDVALNTYAVAFESALGRSVFSRLHAMWSLGAFAGAAIGAGLAALRLSPAASFAAVGLTVLAATALILPRLPRIDEAAPPADQPGEGAQAKVGWSRHGTVLVLSAVAVGAFVVEVTAADWGGVFVREVLDASPTLASATFAAFTLLHFLVRIAGDRVIDRWQRRRLLSVSLLVAAGGMTVVAVSPVTWLAFVGLAVAGGSVALVFPLAVATAGRVPGVVAGAGVATAAGNAYVGWTVTPAVVGGLASVAGLRVAMLFPVVVALVSLSLLRHQRHAVDVV